MNWPKAPLYWMEGRTVFVSIPFTWTLPAVRRKVQQYSFFWDRVIVGGPAVHLLPTYFDDMPLVEARLDDLPGVLQRVHPMATRTSRGCPHCCPFCAVPRLGAKGGVEEYDDWPNSPILVDDNLLACSEPHIDKVFDRLEDIGTADFNQGLDIRLLTDYHAERIKRLKRPIVRIAVDRAGERDLWEAAYERLRRAKVAKGNIRSYALIGFESGPSEAWSLCRWVELHGVKVLPMWYHALDALELNAVTPPQVELGWTDYERRRIMQWYYQHKKAVRG